VIENETVIAERDYRHLQTVIISRIEYKLLSLTYKVLTTSQSDYLHNLISVQSTGRTRSSSVVTLARPSVSSSLQITNRSFTMHYLTCGISSLLR